MREIDSQSLIRGDFILLSGDIVANMRLREAVEFHRLDFEFLFVFLFLFLFSFLLFFLHLFSFSFLFF